MPRRGGRYFVLVKGAEKAMDAFKMEVAQDLGLEHKIDADGTFRDMTTTDVGQIGGEVVRRIQAAGEWAIKQRYEAGERRLMPEEVLPPKTRVRSVTNIGNPSVQVTQDVMHTPGSDQSVRPGQQLH
jgi:hypothetical protein